MFSFKSFIVLAFTLRPLFHFDLIFIETFDFYYVATRYNAVKIQYKTEEGANVGVFMGLYLKSAIVQHKEIMGHSLSVLRHILNNVLGEVAFLTSFLLLPTTCPHLFTHPVFTTAFLPVGFHYCYAFCTPKPQMINHHSNS